MRQTRPPRAPFRPGAARVRAGALAVALAAVLGAAGPAAAGRVAIPGTSVEIEPPAGFALAEGFYGIVHESSGASVHVSEVPGSAAQVRAGLGAEALAARGIELLASGPVDAGIGESTLLHARQDVGGVAFEKWMLVGGGEGGTAVLTAALPADADEATAEALRAALLGATRGPALGAAMPVEAAPFALGSTGGLAVARTVPGSGYALSADGTFPVAEPGDPQLVVARLDREARASRDLETVARARLGAVAGLSGVRVESVRETTLGELPAVEIVATALGSTAGGGSAPVVVFQRLAVDGDHVHVVRGRAAEAERARWLDAFAEVADDVVVGGR